MGEGGPDRLAFNRNSRAPPLEAGGSAEFGALKTADREPVGAIAPCDLVDSCGKRIGVACSVGAARAATDPIPTLPPREPPPPRCALAASIVSASAARAAARISDGLRSVLIEILITSNTLGKLSSRPFPQSGVCKVVTLPTGADEEIEDSPHSGAG